MLDFSPIIVGLAVLVQLAMLVLTIRFIRATEDKMIGLTLAVAIVFPLGRRIFAPLPDGTFDLDRSQLNYLDAFLALGTSLILFRILMTIRRAFNARLVAEEKLKEIQNSLALTNDALHLRVDEQFAKLSNSEAKFQSIIEAFRDAIIVVDSKGDMIYWNAGALEMFGFSENEVLGQPITLIMPEDTFNSHKDDLHRRSAPDQAKVMDKATALTGRKKNGEEFAVELSLSTWNASEGCFYAGIIRDITQKKKLEEERDQFFMVSLDMLAMANTEGYFLRVNPAVVEVLGYTPEEFCSHHATYYIHPDDIKKTIEALEIQDAGHMIKSFENRYRCKDGSYKWLSWKSKPIGKITYGVARDITALKIAEAAAHSLNETLESRIAQRTEELITSREQLKAIVANSDLMLWSIDVNGIFTFVDGKVLRESGNARGELLGQSIFDFIQDDPELSKAIKRAIAGETLIREISSGDECFEGHYAPLHNSRGTIVGVTGVTIDITTRKKSEKALMEAENRLRAILNNAPIIVFTIDRNGIITYSEGLALKKLGVRPNSNRGKSIFDIYEGYPWLTEAIHKTLAGDITTAEGLILTQHLQFYLSPQSSGGAIGLCIDVTERAVIEEERAALVVREKTALEASRMKSEFLANMSHEIRTPINGIVGMTSLLLETKLNAVQQDYAQSVQTSADALLIIINDILDFSKVEAGKLDLENVDFELGILINETIKTFLPFANRKNVQLRVSNGLEANKHFLGDPGRIRQIISNLLSNALKFTEEGEVLMTIEEIAPQTLRIEVKDSGIGISDTAISRLFRSFSQADASTSRRFGGTGLGLSISKHLVEMMGGEIKVESKLGKGSTFWFTIKLGAGIRREERLATPGESPHVFNPANTRILVAEDNAINQRVVISMLQNNGFKATAVGNGHEVINALRSFRFDLILMDCQMPEMDGYEATRIIRSDESLGQQSLPIIALTASAIKGDKEKCLEAGMNDYLSKPIAQRELIATMKKWLAPDPEESHRAPMALQWKENEKLDLNILKTLRALGDELLFRSLIQMYIESVPPKLVAIEAAFKHKDRKSISFGAYNLKSASASLGVLTIRNICQQIEDIDDDADIESLHHLPKLLFEEFKCVQEELERLSKDSTSLVT